LREGMYKRMTMAMAIWEVLGERERKKEEEKKKRRIKARVCEEKREGREERKLTGT
jgi:hypothetical protein